MVDELPAHGPAGGVEGDRGRPRARLRCPRRSATSSRCSRSTACWPTRTPPPGACPRMPASATSSTGCSPRARVSCRPPALELSLTRQEVEEAMRATTETLSQMTNLLAVDLSALGDTATIRHVEVLALQPRVVVVGDHHLDRRGLEGVRDVRGAPSTRASWPGRASTSTSVSSAWGWARGCSISASRTPTLRAMRAGVPRPPDPGVRRARRRSPSTCSTSTAPRGCSRTAHLRDVGQINELMELLERRVALLQRAAHGARASPASTCASATRTRSPRCARWRSWPPGTAWRSASLGIVSVIGPVRMNYAYAIATVREVAHELSRFVEESLRG